MAAGRRPADLKDGNGCARASIVVTSVQPRSCGCVLLTDSGVRCRRLGSSTEGRYNSLVYAQNSLVFGDFTSAVTKLDRPFVTRDLGLSLPTQSRLKC